MCNLLSVFTPSPGGSLEVLGGPVPGRRQKQKRHGGRSVQGLKESVDGVEVGGKEQE